MMLRRCAKMHSLILCKSIEKKMTNPNRDKRGRLRCNLQRNSSLDDEDKPKNYAER